MTANLKHEIPNYKTPAMNRSSFVSIYFTSGKILVVKLNSFRKKVDLYASIDLPAGLISNYEVKDQKALSEILKRVWKKLKIKERNVGIVIPEFSTFTKAINLPKLEENEIDEAVRWQADEYIPLDPKEMILDWKIIDENPEEFRLLVVAVSEKLLKGYVASADLAGLFPIVVETPSLSLVRFAGEDLNPKLVVYFSFDEIIITLSKGAEILTSSVMSADSNPQTLVSTIARILRHYEEINLSNIFVGGMPKNDSFVSEISKNFKVPMEKLHMGITGISENDLQKYLIAISLQYKDTSEPESSKTINLLPREIISKYKKKKFSIEIWGLMLVITLILMGCFMALSGTYLYILQGLSKHSNANSLFDVSYQKSKAASDEIKNVNTLADKTIIIDSINIYPQEVFNLINQKKPESIAILSYEIDLERGSVSIKGLSAGREDLYNFKKKIEEGGDFQKVVLPLTSFEQGENIEFEMSFVYSKLVNSTKAKK